ncbi:MAG: S8 family peptidase [Prevotella sp.]
MKSSMKHISAYFLLCLMAPCGTMAQATLSPRTQIVLSAAANNAKGQTGENSVTAYVTHADGRLSTVHATPSALAAMAHESGISHIQLTARPQQMLDIARAETGAQRVITGESLSKAYTGKGVVVGIVDAGFDYMHTAFSSTADGKQRIRRVWEQGTKSFEGCTAPAKYGYGIEMTTEEALQRAKADANINSHGTHVAAIAAGCDPFMDNAWWGTAPDADIVLVALDQSTCTHADITNAVEYIFDYAAEVGKPCVVNLSLGNHDGPHDGTSAFDRMADAMQGPGRIIVGAAGNHRKDAFHINRTFLTDSDDPLRTFIAFKQKPTTDNYGGEVQVWAERGMEIEVELSAYSTFNKKDMMSVTIYPAEGQQTVKLGSYATGTLTVASEVNPENGKLNVLVTSQLTSVRNNYAVALTVKPKTAGTVDIWADNTWLTLESKGIEGFSAPTTESTIAEIGGTGKRITTVGAYVTRDSYQTATASGKLDETTGESGTFSSCGPTADGRVKPEVSAPGCFIISALSAYDESGTKYVAHTNTTADRAYEYGYMQGTSMASPFVAGIVATWLQANPGLTPETLKEIIAATSRRDTFTGDLTAEGDNEWGHGKIDAYEGLVRCIASTGIKETVTASKAPCDIAINGNTLTLAFLTDTPSAEVSVATAAGTACLNKTLHNVKAATRHAIQLPQPAGGIYIIRVKTASGTRTMKWSPRRL